MLKTIRNTSYLFSLFLWIVLGQKNTPKCSKGYTRTRTDTRGLFFGLISYPDFESVNCSLKLGDFQQFITRGKGPEIQVFSSQKWQDSLKKYPRILMFAKWVPPPSIKKGQRSNGFFPGFFPFFSHIFPKHVDSALPTPATWPSLEGTMREMVEESAFSTTLALKITWCHRPQMPHQKGGPWYSWKYQCMKVPAKYENKSKPGESWGDRLETRRWGVLWRAPNRPKSVASCFSQNPGSACHGDYEPLGDIKKDGHFIFEDPFGRGERQSGHCPGVQTYKCFLVICYRKFCFK